MFVRLAIILSLGLFTITVRSEKRRYLLVGNKTIYGFGHEKPINSNFHDEL